MLDAFVIAVKEDQTEQGKEGESIKASAVRGISASVLVGKAWQWEGLCLSCIQAHYVAKDDLAQIPPPPPRITDKYHHA